MGDSAGGGGGEGEEGDGGPEIGVRGPSLRAPRDGGRGHQSDRGRCASQVQVGL